MFVLAVVAFFFRPNRVTRDDLVLTFLCWTNIDPTGGPFGNVKGFIPVAFGPCALLTVSNRNTRKPIECYTAVSVESLKDGKWIEVARGTEGPWLIAGNGPDTGAARQQPVRILEGLPGENPWRVKVRYNLKRPRTLEFVDDWWRRLTPFDRGIFVAEEHFVASSPIPAPMQYDIDYESPAKSFETDKTGGP